MAEKDLLTRVKLQKGLRIVKRGRIWYAERCVQGLQTRWSLGTEDAGEASRRAVLGQERPDSPLPKPPAKPDTLTLAKALEEYEEWYRKNRRDTGAKRLYPVLHLFADALGDQKDPRTITR